MSARAFSRQEDMKGFEFADQHERDLFFNEMRNDFEYYAPRALWIKPKGKNQGGLIPFCLNFEQRYLHQIAEKQLRETGKVRIIVCKGRQQGVSTYIEARFYWKTSHTMGIKAYILTHEAPATKNLFEMVDRYHTNCPLDLRPATGKSNSKELDFVDLDTKYEVGTAGTKGTGRSQTIHLFHGSEVAYWPHAESHASGVMEGVAEEDGTEKWLESTAAGPGDYYHSVWEKGTDPGAERRGDSNEYIRVFIPWFWNVTYHAITIKGFELDEDEIEIAETYGLTDEQLQWRRNKIASFKDGLAQFQRDYPNTPEEAFSNPAQNTLISPHMVVRARARKNPEIEPYGARILGVDVAREGDDCSALAFRQGRILHFVKAYKKYDNMQLVGVIRKAVREYAIQHIFVDGVGNGSGVIDRLRELDYGHMLTGVKGNYAPLKPDEYWNKRAEMWGEMKEWLDDEPVQIPDDSTLQADLCSLTKKFDSKERMVLEKKADAKKRGVKSPDLADAVAFTFCQPVSLSQSGSFEPEEEDNAGT